MVAKNLSESKKYYAQTLLNVVDFSHSQQLPGPALALKFGRFSFLKESSNACKLRRSVPGINWRMVSFVAGSRDTRVPPGTRPGAAAFARGARGPRESRRREGTSHDLVARRIRERADPGLASDRRVKFRRGAGRRGSVRKDGERRGT